jgi:membrane-associated phospholipid phosphatase
MQLPPLKIFLAYLRFLGVFLFVFGLVYMGSGYLLAQSPGRSVQLYFSWEKDIPLVPWMIWPYLSLFPSYLLPLLHMNVHELQRLSLQSVVTVAIAGLIFNALPAQLGFSPTEVTGWHQPLFFWLARIDTPYNLLPSLHVAGASLILLACGERVGPRWAWFYAAWLAVLALSTLLVHQHHVLDVVSGFGLALVVRQAIPLKPAPVGA